jgi:hypothetical protein
MVAYNNFVLLKPLFSDKNATQDFIKSENFKNKSVQICSYLREKFYIHHIIPDCIVIRCSLSYLYSNFWSLRNTNW